MKGYKAFLSDLCSQPHYCMQTQYKVGAVAETKGKPILCWHGFHFCRYLCETYYWYGVSWNTRICIVETMGAIAHGEHKMCTNKLKVVRELTRDQILERLKVESRARNPEIRDQASKCLKVLQCITIPNPETVAQ